MGWKEDISTEGWHPGREGCCIWEGLDLLVPKMQPGWYLEHPNLAASEQGLNRDAMPWETRGEAAVQGPRMRVWPMEHPARPPQGLGDGLGGGRFAQRGGLVPSPGAGL